MPAMAADAGDYLFDLGEIQQSWNGMTFRGIPRASESFAERVFSKIDASGDCWEWGGTLDDQGYGIVGRGRRGSGLIAAHRAVYELLVGSIPDGMHYDHLCRNHACVNPDHGEIVTPEENKRRGYSIARLHAQRTHCAEGHPLDGMTGGRGSPRKHRYCTTCARERVRKTRTEGQAA
ncbi:HNH endonuclease signature motif containing protein [Streptomyces albidoflavus]|uniref:HNH endonuclease signature motif containing protein n=1 Tax=Streptomyces albidoflavus TaxID=1886 RepID=UPI00331DCB34